MNRKLLYYFGSTFAYGFYRGSTFTHRLTLREEEKSEIFLSDRINNGFIVGICYANPLLQPMFLSNLMNRIEIKVKNRENEKEKPYYRNNYRDLCTYNYRTI
jgi:hypothetical protein